MSGSKRWKGCCMMCAAWIRGDGKDRVPHAALKKLGGRRAVKYPTRHTQED